MIRKTILRSLGAVLVLLLTSLAWGFLFAWRPLQLHSPQQRIAPVQPIMTDREYALGHPNPYIYSLNSQPGTGAVLVYGSVHTNSPVDPLLTSIQEAFEKFDPDVVLCEGRMTGLLFPGLMDPVATYGEPGLVRKLAYTHGCRVYSWEPPEDRLVNGLLDQGYNSEQIALRLILSSYFSNLRYGKPADPNAIVAEALSKKSHWPVIGDRFTSVSDLSNAWRRYFPEGPDWENVSDEDTLPGFLGIMDTNLPRDQHLFDCVTDLVTNGDRVFVIAGSSHAVKLEAALRSTLTGKDLANDISR